VLYLDTTFERRVLVTCFFFDGKASCQSYLYPNYCWNFD